MEISNLEREIRELIAEIIEMDADDIGLTAHLVKDLGVDSMKALEILAAVERKYSIRIPEEELPRIISVSKAVEIAERYGSRR